MFGEGIFKRTPGSEHEAKGSGYHEEELASKSHPALWWWIGQFPRGINRSSPYRKKDTGEELWVFGLTPSRAGFCSSPQNLGRKLFFPALKFPKTWRYFFFQLKIHKFSSFATQKIFDCPCVQVFERRRRERRHTQESDGLFSNNSNSIMFRKLHNLV